MTNAIRAIYEQGHLRLLDPVDLFEGQQIEIMIQEPSGVGELRLAEIDRRLREAGLLAEVDVPEDAEPLSSAELEQLGRMFAADRLISDLVDEERCK
ncbi:MAG: hypothetical protein BroJett018_50610 [Chloroflexota bacterium]|nr:MAG: hypothetical protein BroJett018_50610 [Chloroflexota bacterium]